MERGPAVPAGGMKYTARQQVSAEGTGKRGGPGAPRAAERCESRSAEVERVAAGCGFGDTGGSAEVRRWVRVAEQRCSPRSPQKPSAAVWALLIKR